METRERALPTSDLMTLLLEMEDRGNGVVYPALSEVMDWLFPVGDGFPGGCPRQSEMIGRITTPRAAVSLT